MIELNGKKICENCFSEVEGKFCTQCGYNAETSGFDPLVLKPGSILRGKYIIGKCLGKGGFGVTYLAYDTKADRKVAIKEFFPFGQALRTEGDPTVSVSTEENAAVFKIGAEKFYEEAKLVSRFNGNPNIVSVYEFFYENDTVYFSMEYLSGRTLKDYVQKIGKLTPAQAHLIALNVSNALMAAHSASVLHRDISPDNIMLCNNGEIKLIDFGAARQVIAEHSQTFSVILKPGFAPLEQYKKKGNQGPWTDIYSLGATLYYALTGEIPDDPMSRIDEADETFSENKFNIDEELWEIIRKATMLKIPDRYQDVYALRKDLSELSYSAEPFVVPDEDKAESERPSFRTATVRTARTSEVSAAAAAVQTVPEIQAKKPNSSKKAIIGIACGAVAAVAAAVILVIALNSGNKPNPGEMVDNGVMNNSSAISLPMESASESEPVDSEPVDSEPVDSEPVDSEPSDSEPVEATTQTTTTAATTPKTTTTAATTPKTTTTAATTPKPATTTPKTTTTAATTPKTTTTAATTPKPATTTPKTTTTKKPAEPKPVEVKEVTICGQTYSTDLTELSISESSCDTIPTNKDFEKLKYMTNLETLDLLYMGEVTDISFLEYMPRLTDLAIENENLLTDISPIGKLTGLKKLSLRDSKELSDISAIGKLTHLDSLSLWDLDNVKSLDSLSTLTDLTELNIADIPCDDISFLKNMTKLTSLDICYIDILSNIKDISAIGNLKNLDYLSLQKLRVFDISVLSNLTKLTRLNIYGCPTIRSFEPISKLKNLTFLRLFSNKIRNVSFAYELTNLETLWLTGQLNYGYAANEISDSDLETLRSKLPNCDIH